VKVDAVPGHLNQLWINVEQPGVYYGQCSELCGVNHGFMPITVEAKSKEDFEAWVQEAQTKFARADEAPVNVANAATAVQPAQ
jgi:cytochrome c oxidase subunit 2